VHEPGTIAAFLAIRKYRDCKRVYDLGALYGYFTLLAAGLFEDAEVTAFEMHSGVMGPLKANVAPFATCVHAAVSDQSRCGVKFWISGFNIFEEPEGGWDNLPNIPGAMKDRGANNRGRGFTKVDFITIDDHCATNAPPQLMKIDVEAYQAKAILGALKTIAAHKPAIILELHDADKIARMGTTNKNTVQPLYDLGYRGYRCENFRDPDARFERVEVMRPEYERLSIMVFVP
jgi:FkbM family methyltransferase